MAHPDASVYPGLVFNERWKVGAQLSDGNFSLVYEVEDLDSPSDCAIKVLSLSQHNAQGLLEFRRDADLLTLLSSCSNVIDILDAGTAKVPMELSGSGDAVELDVHYIVLERADASLAQLLVKRHSLGWDDRLRLFRDVVKGMHQAHLRRVAHRDLKTDNVLLARLAGSPIAKISDFGRSRDTRQSSPTSSDAYEVGRGDLRFAPPEFLWGLGTEDAEQMRLADLFLLGSVLFEFATGQGLTGIVFGDPRGIVLSKQGLDGAARLRDYGNSQRRIQRDFEAAYALFGAELDRSIRTEAVELLRLLTSANPTAREPKHIRKRVTDWDLQWLLKRVDRLLLQLRVAKRKQSRLPWKEDRKHGVSA